MIRPKDRRGARVWRRMAVWSMALSLSFVLAACAGGPGAPTAAPGERALLSDADIDGALLPAPGPTAALVGAELPELAGPWQETGAPDVEAGGPLRPLAVLPNAEGVVAFIRHDPDLTNTPWMVYVMDQASDTTTLVYGGRREIDSVAVTADGDTLAVAMRLEPGSTANFEIFRATRSSGTVERLTTTPHDESNVSMSADGSVLVWEGQDAGGRRAVLVREGGSVNLLSFGASQREPSVSGNGRYIGLVRVLANGRHHVVRYDRLENAYLTLWAPLRRAIVAHPSVSDDGERAAFLEAENRPPRGPAPRWQWLRYLDVATNTVSNVVALRTGAQPAIGHPHLARDGDHLTYAWRDQSAWSIFTHRVSTRATQRIVSTPFRGDDLAPYWQMPEPRVAAVRSVTIDQGDQILRVGDQFQLSATVDAVAGASDAVAWSSDDPAVATVTPDGLLTAIGPGPTTTITATSTFDPTKSATITVTVTTDAGSAMILIVDTTPSNGTTVSLPLFGTVDVTVDWGDGSTSTAIGSGLLSHEYAVDGSYTIGIRGTLTQYGGPLVPRSEVFVEVVSWGDLGLQSLAGAFRNARNLVRVPDWLPTTVTNLNGAFDRATAFDGDIGGWDVANVTDMGGMFQSATSFNQDLSRWCVPHIPTQPTDFDAFATSWTAPRPIWGTCGGVPEPRVISVTIDQGDQTLMIGDALQLTATVDTTGGASDTVHWTSDRPEIATITPDGYLTALDAGIATVIATSTFDPGKSATISVTVSVDDGGAMILVVDTTRRSGTTVTLPLYGTVDVAVDWGDGQSSVVTTPGDLTHTYAADGEYTVTIRGSLTQFGPGDAPYANVDRLVSVRTWGDLGLQSLGSAFRNATHLTSVPASLPATVTTLNDTFHRADAFDGDIGGWDTSNVTDMNSTFFEARAFDRDIGAWNTGSVTTMRSMFDGATAFHQAIGSWNTSAVTDMRDMFSGATAFDHDLGAWDVTNVADMRGMFGGATRFNRDLSAWCVPHIPTQPDGFDAFATSWTAPRPIWGTCAGVPEPRVISVTIDQGDQELHIGDQIQLTAAVATVGGASDQVHWTSGDPAIATVTADGLLTAIGRGPTTITATSTFDPTISGTIAVVVEDPRAMVLTIDTVPVFGRSFTLPLWGAVDVTVDWGDGQTSVVTASGNLTHTYAEDGAYTVTVTGSLTQFGSGIVNYPNAQALTGVTAWGELGLERLAGAFHGASRLVSVPATFPAGVWDASHMFALASNFNGDITGWDVSGVTDMRSMFAGASGFDREIGVWDVSNVTTMVGMFQNATRFDRELAAWNVSRVTDMSRMFAGATTFNRDLGAWDTGAVTILTSMFAGATAFNGDLAGWNTSSVTDMSGMFSGALAFNRDIGDWDTASVTTMLQMFSQARAFNQDIGRWNTGRVTSMNGMFLVASRFNQDIGGWDTSNVVDFIAMFSQASDFDQDISRWDIRGAWTLENMFRAATSFNQDIRAWDTSNVRIFAGLFQSATSFDQDIGNWNTGSATSMRNMFDGATAFNQDIGRWDTSKVTTTYMMFQRATAFNRDIGGWNTANVTNMLRMFGGATAFNQPIGSWNTRMVRDMEGMFERAWSFNQDIGGWDTSSVEKMTSMFDDAKAFDQDIGNWNTAKVWTMQTMFRDATSFNRDLSRWCVERIGSPPFGFASGAVAWVLPRPVWGTCPV